jgi:hypothetical protein
MSTGEQRRGPGAHSPSSRHLPGRALALLLALVGTVLALWVAPAAQAAAGQIAGTVTGGSPAVALAGISVTLYDSDQGFVTNTTTAGDGTYAFPGLASSNYYVGFSDPTGAHLTRYANGETSLANADPITVTDPQTTTVDANLPPAGTFTGLVQDSGGPVAGITVTAYLSNGRPSDFSTTTGTDGRFSLSVDPGTYEIGFTDVGRDTSTPDVDQFYDGKPTIQTADPVAIGAGQTMDLGTTTLAAGGAITGAVTTGSSVPAGIEVDLYGQNGDFEQSTTTDGSGAYTFTGLAPGMYKVGFLGGSSGLNVAPSFYDNQSSLAAATLVPLSAGASVTLATEALATGGSITGTATDAGSSTGLPGIVVAAYDASGSFVTSTTTAAGGTYALVGLAPGTYSVAFSDPNGAYLTRYYADSRSLAAATPVTVVAGQPTTGIDQALPQAGLIAGTVTAGGTGLADVEVTVYDADRSAVAVAFTGSDGTYTVGGLEAGSYFVGFTPFSSTGLAPQFFDSEPTLASADRVVVTAGATASGVDASLSPAPGTGQITGSVTGAPPSGVTVEAFPAGQTSAVQFASPNSDGFYTLSGLTPGTYRVGFFASGQVTQFYDAKPSLALADPVTVTAGATTPNVNATLVAAGAISGTVTAGGTPVAGAFVTVYDAGGNGVAFLSTAPDGTYTTSPLQPGAYEVGVEAAGFVSQFYVDAPSIATATPVDVLPGQTTTASLALTASGPPPASGAIAGTVTDSAGRPLDGVVVTLYDSSGDFFDNTTTAVDGSYRFSGLPVGSYKIGFDARTSDPRHNYVPQFFNGKPTLAAADPVAVTAGRTATADASLVTGLQISGVVTDQAGDALTGLEVDLYDSSKQLIASTSTAADGSYTFAGLAAGTYYVGFDTSSFCGDECGGLRPAFVSANGLLPQFWMNQATLASATPIILTTADQTGIDAVLPPGGQITGTVTGPAGDPLPSVEVDLYDSTGALVADTFTGQDGSYRFQGLPSGTYRVGVVDSSGRFAPRFYDARATLATADPVDVTAPQTHSGVNIALTAAGAISGTVTDSTGSPRGGIDVTVLDGAGSPVGFAETAADGTYTVTGLAPGDYNVGFALASASAQNVAPQYYDGTAGGAATPPSPPAVTVATAVVPNVDAQLQPAGEITGTVTDTAGHALQGIIVTVYRPDGSVVTATTTDSAGVYGVGGLTAAGAPYVVGFDPGPGGADYLPRFYLTGTPTGSPTLAGATQLTLTGSPPSPVHGIDIELPAGGQITGTVTDALGNPLAGATVTVYDTTAAHNTVGTATTDALGHYVETKLETGSYLVGFTLAGYVSQFYSGSTTMAGATPVNVTVGSTTPAINATLAPLAALGVSTQVSPASIQLGSAFRDTATLTGQPAGGPVPGGSVTFTVFGPADTTCAGPTVFTSTDTVDAAGTATSGSFTPTALGTYRVVAAYGGDDSYAPAASSCADATEAVTVTRAALTLATQVSAASVALGASFHDTATLSGQPEGPPAPTGTVAFAVFGPSDPTCAGTPAFTSSGPLDPGGTTATSGTFTPTVGGTYRVVASYGGDADYAPSASLCADPTELVTVGRAALTLATQVAPASIALGASFTDTATLSGRPVGAAAPTGTVTFDVYGPSDPTCGSAPVLTATGGVDAAGTTATSTSLTPASAGTYRVVASYGGDASYATSASACGDPNESVTVGVPAPAVTGLSPTSGPAAGGTTVTISGSNLGGATAVAFGAAAATGFSVISPSQVTATAPAGTGTVDVTVTTPGGTSPTGTADRYTYAAPPPPAAPVITAVAPSSGPTSGTNGVLIFGTGLRGVTVVMFGSTPAAVVAGNAAGTQLSVLAPAGSGTVDLTVTTPGGTSARTAADQYTYVAAPPPPPAPAVTGLAPATGPAAGGTTVTIAGTGLSGATGVSFGGAPASGFTVDGPTQITATAPAGSGTVDVTVTTPGGTSATGSADQYAYAPAGGPPPAPGGTPTGPTGTPAAPTSQTGPPEVISSSSAEFKATINPEGLPTTMHFEYTVEGGGASAAAITYDASTPEQTVGSDFADHTVTATVAGLLPNSSYHVRAVATNPSGVTPGGDTTFKTASDPPPPPPVLGKSVDAVVVSGTVSVLLPGQGHISSVQAHASAAKGVGFIPLTEARQLPVGTIFDTTGGVARLTTATTAKGNVQSGDFSAGVFKLLQDRHQKGLTELDLVEGASVRSKCATAGKAQAQTAAKKALPKTVLNLLRATVKGKFKTRGKYSSASVRGTVWTTSDRCDGTLTAVKRGVVVVNDLRRKRQIVLRAGRAYLAKAP